MTRRTLLFASMSAGLAMLYGVAGYLALNPRSSDSYRAYFIDRTLEVMDDDGNWYRPVNPGQWVAYDSNDIGYVGFSGPESGFRWSAGKKAAVLIDAACGPDWRGVVSIRLDSNGVQRAVFSLNGGFGLVETVRPGQTELELRFPDGVLRCGHNRLDIGLPDAHSPSARDPRMLGLAFRAVRVE